LVRQRYAVTLSEAAVLAVTTTLALAMSGGGASLFVVRAELIEAFSSASNAEGPLISAISDCSETGAN
jgi:hypothetical protein